MDEDEWATMWTRHKQAFCCHKFGKGCGAVGATDWDVGSYVVAAGRRGRVEWDGWPDHRYVKVRFDANPDVLSDVISCELITKVLALPTPPPTPPPTPYLAFGMDSVVEINAPAKYGSKV